LEIIIKDDGGTTKKQGVVGFGRMPKIVQEYLKWLEAGQGGFDQL